MHQEQLLEMLHYYHREYEKLLSVYDKRLKALPSGSLCRRIRSGQLYYYREITEKGRHSQIPIPVNTHTGHSLIQGLAEKRAILHGRKILQKNIRGLRDVCASFNALDPSSCAGEVVLEDHITLPDRVFLPGQLNVNKWVKETLTGQYRTNQAYPERLRYRTRSGTRVRSKSEVFWSDALEGGGWQFRYECALRLRSGHVIYPDFTVLLPAERRLVYIEHFGRMDDPEYAMRAMQRLQDYADNGYMLGRDVFFTTETSSLPLTSRQINAVLQRLAS